MSLAEKLKKANKPEPGLPCGVARLLAIVNDEDREALEIIFSTKAGNGSVSNLKIHEIIFDNIDLIENNKRQKTKKLFPKIR